MSNPTFMHFRVKANGVPYCRGGMTLAIQPNPEGTLATIAIARCSRKDVFHRKLGRDIALGRMRNFIQDQRMSIDKQGNHNILLMAIPEGAILKDAVHQMMSPILDQANLE